MEQTEDQANDGAARLIALVDRQHVLPEDVDARDAIAAVLCVFTVRLSPGEVQSVFSAVPAAIRSMFDTCVLHRDEPPAVFALEEFLRRVADHLDVTPHTARRVIGSVLSALRADLARPAIEEVSHHLPPELQSLWLPDPG